MIKSGDRFGFLTAVRRTEERESVRKGFKWLFKCDCGGEITCRADQVTPVKSPGCRSCLSSRISKKSTHHGACANYETTRLYSIWRAMRFRCRSPTHRSYHNYGGKGVKVCDAWQDFPAFRDWALSHGYTDDLTVDRLDTGADYCPENCEWVTREENARRAMVGRARKNIPKGMRLTDFLSVGTAMKTSLVGG
jgi:hypothetical protein